MKTICIDVNKKMSLDEILNDLKTKNEINVFGFFLSCSNESEEKVDEFINILYKLFFLKQATFKKNNLLENLDKYFNSENIIEKIRIINIIIANILLEEYIVKNILIDKGNFFKSILKFLKETEDSRKRPTKEFFEKIFEKIDFYELNCYTGKIILYLYNKTKND